MGGTIPRYVQAGAGVRGQEAGSSLCEECPASILPGPLCAAALPPMHMASEAALVLRTKGGLDVPEATML